MFSGSARDRYRLPRVNLGPGHVSLPDAAAAGVVNRHSEPSRGIALVLPRGCRAGFPRRRCALPGTTRPQSATGAGLIAALQDCVMQIGQDAFCADRT